MAGGRRGGGLIPAETVKIGKELALLRAGKKRNKRHKTENICPGGKAEPSDGS